MKTEENRKFFRVKCKEPICTQISIVKVNNETVTTGTGNICLEDIGSGGLKFLSGLNMPVSDVMMIEFKLVITEELNAFYGYIVRKDELDEGTFRYGVKFINDVAENEQSIRKLNKLNESGALDSPKFCYGNVCKCFEKYKGKKNINLYKKYKFRDKIPVKMYMAKSGDKDINYDWEQILINNISLGDIEFTSHFRIIGIENKMLDFKLNASDKDISAKGYVFSEEFEKGIYSYTVKFHISDLEKKILMQVLKNELHISTAKNNKKWKCFSDNYNQHRYKDKNFDGWA